MEEEEAEAAAGERREDGKRCTATNRSRHGTDMLCIIKREVVGRDDPGARVCACAHADAPTDRELRELQSVVHD